MTAPSLRVRAARGARWTLAATLATAGTQAAQLLVLGRLLTPRDFGLMGALAIVLASRSPTAISGSARPWCSGATRRRHSSRRSTG
jgi:hypothetical protein